MQKPMQLTSGCKYNKPDKFKGYYQPFKQDETNKTSHWNSTPLSGGFGGHIHFGSTMHHDKECQYQDSKVKNIEVYFAQADGADLAGDTTHEEPMAESEEEE